MCVCEHLAKTARLTLGLEQLQVVAQTHGALHVADDGAVAVIVEVDTGQLKMCESV